MEYVAARNVPHRAGGRAITALRCGYLHLGRIFRTLRRARTQGYRYIHSGDESLLIAGVATEILEMLEDAPDLHVIIVPVGGGSGAAGACIVAHAVNPSIRVIGVQAAASPAAYQSWRQRTLVEAPNRTFAEGLATGTAFALPQRILWQMLDEFDWWRTTRFCRRSSG